MLIFILIGPFIVGNEFWYVSKKTQHDIFICVILHDFKYLNLNNLEIVSIAIN
jgi:hypothetical protein